MRLLLPVVALVAGCQREERAFNVPGASDRPLTLQPQTHLMAGPTPIQGETLDSAMPGYTESAYNIAEGANLFMAMNCVGCHANGGGAIGPALIDSAWLYGSAPAAIARTIIGGRPNGMPSYRGKLTTQQVYQLVSYVRSLGRLAPGTATPSRPDDIEAAPLRNLSNGGWP